MRCVTALVGVVALATLAACGSSGSSGSSGTNAATASGDAAASTSMTLLLDWFPNPDHVSLYTAQKDGDWKAQGLNVKLQAPSNSTDALKLVSLGQVQLAITYEPQIITAATQNLDITAVGALIPNSLTAMILSGKQGITQPKQLEGKTLGSTGDPVTDKIFDTVLQHYGVDSSKVKVVSLDQGLVPAIVSGKVAGVTGAYPNIEGVQLKDEGIDPQIFRASDAGVDESDELVIIAQKSKLQKDPAYQSLVRKFLAGLAKGDAKAQADPAYAVQAIKPVAKGYSADELVKMVDATVPFLKNPAGGFGKLDVTKWQSFADWMLSEKLLTKHVDVNSVVDNSYLPNG